jgi:hypothetical protein
MVEYQREDGIKHPDGVLIQKTLEGKSPQEILFPEKDIKNGWKNL